MEELKAKRQAEAAREAQWARTAMATDAAVKEQQRRADDFRKRQVWPRNVRAFALACFCVVMDVLIL